MAIYHLSAKPISRAAGRSVTAAAAYRAAERILDERTGELHDYTRKAGVLHAELVLPGGASPERAEFWNRIELHHKRGDAVVAREVEVALPSELTAPQRRALVVNFAHELADRYGVAVDVALHAPRTVTDRDLEKNPGQHYETDPETGRRHNGNWHAHILLSACHVAPDGTLGKKAVALDPIHCQRAKVPNLADRERERWGELANAALARHGHEARIDHRSHAERGIQAEPSQHLGPAAAAIERRTGQPSRKRLDHEREVAERLERAQRAGELERQGRTLAASMLDLSGDLRAALQERERLQAERERGELERRQAIEEARRQAAAGMAAFREQFELHKTVQAGKRAVREELTAELLRQSAERAAERERQAQQQQQREREQEQQRQAEKQRQQHERKGPSPGR